MKKIIIVACILCMMSGFAVFGQEDNNQKRLIVVSGEGEAAFEPDIVMVHAGVTTNRVKVKDCYEENNQAMSGILKELKERGIAKEDIKTIQFSLNPQYDYVKGKREFKGYQLRHVFLVKIRDMDKTGEILDKIVEAGATDVSNIVFTSDKLEQHESAAREKAIKDAEEKARILAKSAGVKRGDVVRIEEISGGRGRFPAFQESSLKVAGASPPIMPGELKVQVVVKVYFLIAE